MNPNQMALMCRLKTEVDVHVKLNCADEWISDVEKYNAHDWH